MKQAIIINPDATAGKSAINYFTKKNISYIISKKKGDMNNHFLAEVKKGIKNFIVCSGDGGINSLVHTLMVLPKQTREKITLGVLPGGKANDFARAHNTSLNIPKAYTSLRKVSKKVDVITLNNKHHFVTGGGFGLTPEIMAEVDFFSSGKGMYVNRIGKSLVYQLVVIKKLFTGFKGLEKIVVNGKLYEDVMLVAVMNQSFHGKNYFLAPKAKNDDGLLDVVIIFKPKNFFERVSLFRKISGNKSIDGAAYLQKKQVKIQSNKIIEFVGDGEFLLSGKEFNFKVQEKVLNIRN